MTWLDVLDFVGGSLSRRWKRYLVLAGVVAFMAFPDLGSRALLWYGNERAQQLVDVIITEVTFDVPEAPTKPSVHGP
jgi:hypothetical protein